MAPTKLTVGLIHIQSHMSGETDIELYISSTRNSIILVITIQIAKDSPVTLMQIIQPMLTPQSCMCKRREKQLPKPQRILLHGGQTRRGLPSWKKMCCWHGRGAGESKDPVNYLTPIVPNWGSHQLPFLMYGRKTLTTPPGLSPCCDRHWLLSTPHPLLAFQDGLHCSVCHIFLSYSSFPGCYRSYFKANHHWCNIH